VLEHDTVLRSCLLSRGHFVMELTTKCLFGAFVTAAVQSIFSN